METIDHSSTQLFFSDIFILKIFLFLPIYFIFQEENVLARPNKSRDVVQSKNLLSKFLYYSIGEEKTEESLHETVAGESSVTVRTVKKLKFTLPHWQFTI